MIHPDFKETIARLMLISIAGVFPGYLPAAPKSVDSKESLDRAVRTAAAGTVVRIAPGTYPGGLYFAGLKGTADSPIVIEAADPENPPLFSTEQGGRSAIHLSGCSHLVLKNLSVSGFPVNGINADDGGNQNQLAIGLQFENLVIENTGPHGNHDALKLSGLGKFAVTNCIFRGWGGSAIDMVGCHDGRIDHCTFEGLPEYSQQNGVQMKGGSSKIQVTHSRFRNAGQRAINLGGSTGLPHFRPMDADWEAREIEVAGNTFIGSLTPIAWVGIDGGHVHHNSIILPEKWVGRILQENSNHRFGRCRNGLFEKNLVVFDRRVRVFINVGSNTESGTFQFRGNAWYDIDNPGRGPTNLPVPETDGVVGIDPELQNVESGDLKVRSTNPRLKDIGAGAFK